MLHHIVLLSSIKSLCHLIFTCLELNVWLWLGTANLPGFDDKQSDGKELGGSWGRLLSIVQTQINGLLHRKCLNSLVTSLSLVEVQRKSIFGSVGIQGAVRGILQLWVHPSHSLSLLDQRGGWKNNKGKTC